MNGSQRQVEWATEIRSKIAAKLSPLLCLYLDELSGDTAKWWIDNRDQHMNDMLEDIAPWLENRKLAGDEDAAKVLEKMSKNINVIHKKIRAANESIAEEREKINKVKLQITQANDMALHYARTATTASRRYEVDAAVAQVVRYCEKIKLLIAGE